MAGLYDVDRVLTFDSFSSPEGERDLLTGKSVSTTVQQAVAYAKFHPENEYVPQTVLLDLLHEQQGKERFEDRRSQLCGFEFKGSQYCVSVHGADRRQLRVLCVGGDDERRFPDRFGVYHHKSAVEELYCNSPGRGEPYRFPELFQVPLLAARTAGSIDYYKIVVDSRDSGREELVRLSSVEGVSTTCSARTRDFSWSQYVTTCGVVLEDSGILSQTDVCDSKKSRYRTCVVDGYAGGSADGILGIRCCESSPLHPDLAMVAWQDVLLRVDFREKTSILTHKNNVKTLEFYNFGREHTYLTSFAVAHRGVCANHYATAAATPSHVHMFDLRMNDRPVVSWENKMKPHLFRMSAWRDVQASYLDSMKFVSLGGKEDALVSSDSFYGTSMLLRWRNKEEYPALYVSDGKIQEIKSVDSIERTYESISKSLSFVWKPISMQKIEPVGPHLLYNDFYPPCMVDIVERQENIELAEQYKIECLGRQARYLPPKNQKIQRDFGVAIINASWDKEKTVFNPTILRFISSGDIVIGSIGLEERAQGDNSEHVTYTTAVPSSTASLSVSARKKSASQSNDDASESEQEEINFESSGFAHAFDNQVDAPMHGWVFYESQIEFKSAVLGEDEEVEGFSRDDVELFLDHLFQNIEGVPISAYEAWHILQQSILSLQKDEQGDINSIIAELPTHTSLFSRTIAEKQQPLKRKTRETSKGDLESLANNTFTQLMDRKGFMDILGSSTYMKDSQTTNIGPSVHSSGWKPSSPLLPSKAFQSIWDNFTLTSTGDIISWRLQCPTVISHMMENIGPLHGVLNPEEFKKPVSSELTALEESIVSIKVLLPSSSKGRIPMRTSTCPKLSLEADQLLDKLKTRWKKSSLA